MAADVQSVHQQNPQQMKLFACRVANWERACGRRFLRPCHGQTCVVANAFRMFPESPSLPPVRGSWSRAIGVDCWETAPRYGDHHSPRLGTNSMFRPMDPVPVIGSQNNEPEPTDAACSKRLDGSYDRQYVALPRIGSQSKENTGVREAEILAGLCSGQVRSQR